MERTLDNNTINLKLHEENIIVNLVCNDNINYIQKKRKRMLIKQKTQSNFFHKYPY